MFSTSLDKCADIAVAILGITFAVKMFGKFTFSVCQLDEMDWAEISTSDGDRQKEDSETVATAADTIAESVSASLPVSASASECHSDSGSASASSLVSPVVSDSFSESSLNCGTVITDLRGNSSCESLNWSIVVNGTRYLGHLSSGGGSIPELEDTDHAVASSSQETTKERSRRLLIQDRLIQAGLDKSRRSRRPSKRSKQMAKFRAIKNKHVTDKGGKSTFGRGDVVSEDGAAVDVLTSHVKDSTTYARQREVKIILERKIRLLFGRKQVRLQFRKRINKRGIKRTRMFGWYNPAGLLVIGAIKLYSCSAFRYTMFRSNRRFKPGD